MTWDRIYTLDINSLGIHLLPIDLRKPKMVAWIKSMLKPVGNLHTHFINYRRKTVYKIDHTSQVYSMEKVCNDKFDQAQRRIYIVDGVYKSALYFYNPDENAPIHFYNSAENNPQHFYNPEELQNLDVDFVVVLPTEFQIDYSTGSPQNLRLKSLIDFYRFPDKTYEISFEN